MARSDDEKMLTSKDSVADPQAMPVGPLIHDSDCAIHNGPAMAPGPCNCRNSAGLTVKCPCPECGTELDGKEICPGCGLYNLSAAP